MAGRSKDPKEKQRKYDEYRKTERGMPKKKKPDFFNDDQFQDKHGKIKVIDPILFQKTMWPDITLYKEQKQILYSLQDNVETYVPAGNELGKDFISAMAILWFFCSRRPVRGIATSVESTQLEDVLWGEIRRLVEQSAYNLPIYMNHQQLRQVNKNGDFVPLCEFRGRVAEKGESLLGRHLPGHEIPRTLLVVDEASGIDDSVYESGMTWADRLLVIGNPYECTNFFYRAVKAGNIPNPSNTGLFRSVIRIKAEHSPNVRYQQARIEAGMEPDDTVLVPGVLTYEKYVLRRETWDERRQTIGLDAEFYEGKEDKMYPNIWLTQSLTRHKALNPNRVSQVRALGVDPAEGGDSSTWNVVDELGMLEEIELKTPDTSKIVDITLRLIHKWDIPHENVVIDRGGGGKQIADQLRRLGIKITTVAFGESSGQPKKRMRKTHFKQREEVYETRYTYKNRRAQMYHELRLRMDPSEYQCRMFGPFGIDESRVELVRQMRLIPLKYDRENRIIMPPKRKLNRKDKTENLTTMLGRSPDNLDSLVLAVFGLKKSRGSLKIRAGRRPQPVVTRRR